jgi:hypothetical protein
MKMKKSHDMKWISKTKSKKCVDAIWWDLGIKTKSQSFWGRQSEGIKSPGVDRIMRVFDHWRKYFVHL